MARSRIMVFFSLCLSCLMLSLVTACGEPAAMPGDAVSVNGQGISFHSLEQRRADLFAARSPSFVPLDDAALAEQYRYVLRQLIEEAIIIQYMNKKEISLTPGKLEAEEARIRGDYPEYAFEETLLAQGITLDIWREQLHSRLLIRQFLDEVLRQNVEITQEEVESYYRAHSGEFVIPGQWHFLQVSGKDNKPVEAAGKALASGADPAAVQREFLISIHDIQMGEDVLPEDLQKVLATLAPDQASAAEEVGKGEYRSLVLLEKTAPSTLDAAEIFKRVERMLMEEKMPAAYSAWMQKQLQKADIRIAPALVGNKTPEAGPAPADTLPAGNGTGQKSIPNPE